MQMWMCNGGLKGARSGAEYPYVDSTKRRGRSSGGREGCGARRGGKVKRGGRQPLPVEAGKGPSWGMQQGEKKWPMGVCVENNPYRPLPGGRSGRGFFRWEKRCVDMGKRSWVPPRREKGCMFVSVRKASVAPPVERGNDICLSAYVKMFTAPTAVGGSTFVCIWKRPRFHPRRGKGTRK